MSESQDKRVRVEYVIEYSVFSHVPVTLSDIQDETVRFQVVIQSVGENQFSCSLLSDDPKVKSKFDGIKVFRATVGYRKQLLSFEVSRIEGASLVLKENYHFSHPVFAHLSNVRRQCRFRIAEGESYKVVLASHENGKIKKLMSKTLRDLSPNHLSLYLERSQGLLLPGDEIDAIAIYDGEGKILLEARGSVYLVDTARKKEDAERNYLCVIQLKAIDCEGRKSDNQERRSSHRLSLIEDASSFIEFNHPFTHQKLTASLYNVSPSGLGFVLKGAKAPLYPGMHLYKVSVQLPMLPRFQVSIKIHYAHVASNEQELEYRLGAVFTELTVEIAKKISTLMQKVVHKNLYDANMDDYDALWELFFENGFVYRKKRELLQPFAKEIFNTYLRLLNVDAPILKKVIYKEQGEIKGHISAVRFFDNTWLGQHLTAVKAKESSSAAQELLRAITGFFKHNQSNVLLGTRYMVFYYRPESLFPSMVYGEAREYINNRKACDYIEYDYCLPIDGEVIRAQKIGAASTDVREAAEEDLYEIEHLLISQKQEALIRIEGLSAEGLNQLNVAKDFENLGLYRNRKIFVAESRNSDLKIYAICNYTSPGVNLSELTNSFRILVSRPNSPEVQVLADRVAAEVLKSYSKTHMTIPILLRDPSGVLPIQFQKGKSYRYWFIDVAYGKQFEEAIEIVFKDLKSHLKKYHSLISNEKAA